MDIQHINKEELKSLIDEEDFLGLNEVVYFLNQYEEVEKGWVVAVYIGDSSIELMQGLIGKSKLFYFVSKGEPTKEQGDFLRNGNVVNRGKIFRSTDEILVYAKELVSDTIDTENYYEYIKESIEKLALK